jgi:hypothetical protein
MENAIHNIEAAIALILAVKIIAEVIVNLTPTPEDDKWVGRFYRLVEVIAGVITKTAKELPGERNNPDKRLRELQHKAEGEHRADSKKQLSSTDHFGVWDDHNE